MQTTAEKIIAAAVSVMGQKGYTAATTREIADQAGVNEVTLFRHFGSKRGLLEAVGAQITEHSSRPLLPKQPPFDMRKVLQQAALVELANVKNFGSLAVRLALESNNPEVAEALATSDGPEAGLAQMAKFFELAQEQSYLRRDISPIDLAAGFSAITSSLAIQSQLVSHLDVGEATMAALVDLFCDGAQIP